MHSFCAGLIRSFQNWKCSFCPHNSPKPVDIQAHLQRGPQGSDLLTVLLHTGFLWVTDFQFSLYIEGCRLLCRIGAWSILKIDVLLPIRMVADWRQRFMRIIEFVRKVWSWALWARRCILFSIWASASYWSVAACVFLVRNRLMWVNGLETVRSILSSSWSSLPCMTPQVWWYLAWGSLLVIWIWTRFLGLLLLLLM
jgi:hypothetical protein